MSSLFHIVFKSSCFFVVFFLHSPTKSLWCSRPMQSTHSPRWSRTATSTSPQDPILAITPRMPTTNKVETKKIDQNMTQQTLPGSRVVVVDLCEWSILNIFKMDNKTFILSLIWTTLVSKRRTTNQRCTDPPFSFPSPILIPQLRVPIQIPYQCSRFPKF